MNKLSPKRPENKHSRLLDASENEALFSMFAKDSYSLATGVVELLFTTAEINGDWRIEGYGVACLVKDYLSRSYSIHVVGIINKEWLLCQFLHQDFCVDQPHSCLIAFQTDSYRMGLNFSDETEAKTFKTSIDKTLKRQNKAQESANQQSRSPQSPYGLTSNRIPSLPESNEQTFSGNSLPSAVTAGQQKPTTKRVKNSRTKMLTKADIGGPTQFKHVFHVGWNADQGFRAEPPTTRRIELEPDIQELPRQLETEPVSKSDRKSRRRRSSSRASDSRSSTSDNKSSGSRTAVQQSTEYANQQSRSPQSPFGLTSTRIPSLPGSNEQSFSGVFDAAVTAGSAKNPNQTIKGENNSGTKKLTKADIGGPTQFEHVVHVGWEAVQGFLAEAPTTRHIELEPYVQSTVHSPQSPDGLTSTRTLSLPESNEQSFSGMFDAAVTADSAKRPKSTSKRDKNSGTKKLTKADIGGPTQFEHVVHVGWNADQEFQPEAPTTRHIELEDVQELLRRLEINTVSKSDRKIIQRVIDNNAGGLEHLRNAKRTSADHNDNQDIEQLPETVELGGIAGVRAKASADQRGQIADSSDDSSDSDDDDWND